MDQYIIPKDAHKEPSTGSLTLILILQEKIINTLSSYD